MQTIFLLTITLNIVFKIKAIWKVLNVSILLYFKVICEKILHSRSFGLPVSYPGLLSSKHLNKRIKTVSTYSSYLCTKYMREKAWAKILLDLLSMDILSLSYKRQVYKVFLRCFAVDLKWNRNHRRFLKMLLYILKII